MKSQLARTRSSLLTVVTLAISACVGSAESEDREIEAASSREYDGLEYISKDDAAKALAANGGVALLPTGEQILLTADDLCDNPGAHANVPDGYKLIPNETQDGFLVVSDTVDDVTFRTMQFELEDSVTCSGCTKGCAPYSIEGGPSGCTSGCTKCTLE